MLRILSEVLNGNPLDLKGQGLFLALETTVQSSGDLSREWGRGSEGGPLAHTLIFQPCSCFGSLEKLVSETRDVAETRIDAILTLQG